MKRKIFGLGLSKTGTSSLNTALNRLGFRSIHYPMDDTTYSQLTLGQYELEVLKKFDGITDITTVPIYKHLDALYKDSRFILTTRDKEAWLESIKYHIEYRMAGGRGVKAIDDFGSGNKQDKFVRMARFLHAAVYGCYGFSWDRFSQAYDDHIDDVRRYFKDQPHKLLCLDIFHGGGWNELCPFLGVEIPNEMFPHEKKRNQINSAVL